MLDVHVLFFCSVQLTLSVACAKLCINKLAAKIGCTQKKHTPTRRVTQEKRERKKNQQQQELHQNAKRLQQATKTLSSNEY